MLALRPPHLRSIVGVAVLMAPPLLCTPYFYLWYNAGPISWENRYEPYLLYVMAVLALLGSTGLLLFPLSRIVKLIAAASYIVVMGLALFVYGFFWCPLCDF